MKPPGWVKIVVSRKIDLDTVGAAFMLSVSAADRLEVVSDVAHSADLKDSDVLCIEVGASGCTEHHNFDHHERGGPTASATMQAWEHAGRAPALEVLARYIDTLDTRGVSSAPRAGTLSLSQVFAGMLLTEETPENQFGAGLGILEHWAEKGLDLREGVTPGAVPAWGGYIEAKRRNNDRLASVLSSARWSGTRQGRRLAAVTTSIFGAPGALYRAGAEIVVALNPDIGTPAIRKFTIAAKDLQVTAVLDELDALEPGWGGPATGTIVGSPRSGSKLSMEKVADTVRRCL